MEFNYKQVTGCLPSRSLHWLLEFKGKQTESHSCGVSSLAARKTKQRLIQVVSPLQLQASTSKATYRGHRPGHSCLGQNKASEGRCQGVRAESLRGGSMDTGLAQTG